MDQALKNYGEAMKAHMEAQKQEAVAKDTLKKTRYAVVMAREELRGIEQEILNDSLRDL